MRYAVDLTHGPVLRSMLVFSLPLITGNLLQQGYNIADTVIVGRLLGGTALAAVGSSFSLMTFLTSIFIGLCMGSGALLSIRFGQEDRLAFQETLTAAFTVCALCASVLTAAAFLFLPALPALLRVPPEVRDLMQAYLLLIFAGIPAIFLFNFYACILRAVGNSLTPLVFLGAAAGANIGLDLLFVLALQMDVAGTALATILAQYLSACLIGLYVRRSCPELHFSRSVRVRRMRLREVAAYSFLTCAQQSVMNLGILVVQGLVNSFGTAVMAAFAAGVKIDAFAYAPAQDFGNAFSTFTAQNFGAVQHARIRRGFRDAVLVSSAFTAALSFLIWHFARPLMQLFVGAGNEDILAEGIRYLRTEGAFYPGIGCLFLLYGLYRAIGKPGVSLVLTILSLGTRVFLAYFLSAVYGTSGIWWSVPVGWGIADAAGILFYFLHFRKRFHYKAA